MGGRSCPQEKWDHPVRNRIGDGICKQGYGVGLSSREVSNGFWQDCLLGLSLFWAGRARMSWEAQAPRQTDRF